ncbi:MAG: ABC transporter ATP-binding protein, partial [Alphaproteobacteria bacterium]|nr:ABC transporter ATP-binding protein [Alphaproteobacteria bacterium]
MATAPDTRTASAPARAPLLSVRGVKTYYGNIVALRGVDLDVHE